MGRGSMMFTQQGMVFGTPEFMSPEQAQGEELDRRSDIYSLALILYELMTGQLPFEAKTPLDMMKAHVKDPPIPISQRVPGLKFSAELEATIAKALAKKPDDRYATAADFGEALRGCLRESAEPASTGAPPSPGSLAPVAGSSGTGSPSIRSDTHVMSVPVSRTPSLLLGLIIGIGFATACYFIFGQLLR
jgi:serine/threonine protein kinase